MLQLFLVIALFEGRIVFPDNTPAAHFEVAVVGRPSSVRTDAAGRFRMDPPPPLPARLIVIGARGEIYPPVTIDDAEDLEIRLQPMLQESMTVVSGVAPNIESGPAAATTLVSRRDLRERQPARVSEAISGMAGVSGDDGGAPSVPVIRGMSRGRTLIVLDGARVATERRAGASATFINPFSLSAVEVSRGPGSVAYGSDAFGGVILLRSREPEPGESNMRYDAGTTFGAADTTHAGFELIRSLSDRTSMLFSLHGQTAGDSTSGSGDPIPVSSFRNAGGALRLVSDTPLGLFRLGYQLDEGRDVGKPERDSTTVRNIYPIESSHRASGRWERDRIEIDAVIGRYRLMLDRENLVAGDVERSDVSANDASLRLIGRRAIGQASLRGGLDVVSRFGLEATSFEEVSIEDAQRTDTGAFVLYDHPFHSRVTFSAGGRVDSIQTENRGGYFQDHSTSQTAFSGHAGVTAVILPRLTGAIQIARAFRDPTLSDRYFRGVSGRGFVTGNPALEAEKSLQADGVLRWTGSRLSIGVAAYSYRITDLIERYREEDGNAFFRNRGEVTIRGFEVEGELDITDQMQAQLAYSNGSSREPVDGIPPAGGHFTVRWTGASAFALARVSAFGSVDDPGPSEVPIAGYTTVDAGFGWRYSERAELRLYASNLFDRRYFASADEIAPPATGRSIGIAVGGSW